MANDYKNFTTQIAKTVLENVESLRTLSKNVNVQKLQGVFNPDSGEEYNFKRPIRVKAIRTSDGDLTSSSPSNIITGRAKGLAQDYITTYVEITDVEQALKAGNLNDTLRPMAEELVMELENSQAEFMMANSGLMAGTPGTGCPSSTLRPRLLPGRGRGRANWCPVVSAAYRRVPPTMPWPCRIRRRVTPPRLGCPR